MNFFFSFSFYFAIKEFIILFNCNSSYLLIDSYKYVWYTRLEYLNDSLFLISCLGDKLWIGIL